MLLVFPPSPVLSVLVACGTDVSGAEGSSWLGRLVPCRCAVSLTTSQIHAIHSAYKSESEPASLSVAPGSL